MAALGWLHREWPRPSPGGPTLSVFLSPHSADGTIFFFLVVN